jgi:hypothetical protein
MHASSLDPVASWQADTESGQQLSRNSTHDHLRAFDKMMGKVTRSVAGVIADGVVT